MAAKNKLSNIMVFEGLAASLFLFVGTYVLAYYFLDYSIRHFFAVGSDPAKLIILAALFFLSVSFFISSLLSHLWDNAFTRGFYIFSGFWLGLFTYLIISSGLIWFFIWIFNLTDASVQVWSGIFFIISLAYIIYGTWNAFNPRIKNVEVKIKNLPSNWRGKKIVQLSDIHLGHVYRENFMEKVVRETNALQPDIVVITGDLFDGMDGNLHDFVAPLNDLQAPRGIYFITGNHETYLGVEKSSELLRQTKVRILDDEVRNIDGLQLIGISYPERGESKDVAQTVRSLKDFDPEKPSVLLYHSPVNISEIEKTGVNLELCGHTHKGQIVPFGFVTKAVYRGYDYGLHTNGNFSVYTTTGVGTWGPPARTGNSPEIVRVILR